MATKYHSLSEIIAARNALHQKYIAMRAALTDELTSCVMIAEHSGRSFADVAQERRERFLELEVEITEALVEARRLNTEAKAFIGARSDQLISDIRTL